MRTDLFRSGVPIIIGGVCFLVLAYLARVRRERFLIYWSGAWALLLLRFFWNAAWGSPWPFPYLGSIAAFMRLTFAACLLAGTEELRGSRVKALPIFAAAFAYIVAKEFIDPLLPRWLEIGTNLGIMSLLMLAASWRLGTYESLPRAERALAAGALGAYALLTGGMPFLADNSEVLEILLYVSWTAQLCVGFGMLALYFRSSYEAELRIAEQRGSTLAEALQEFMPICMHCKSIRDEQQNWKTIEQYVAGRSDVKFSHSVCPTCIREHYADTVHVR